MAIRVSLLLITLLASTLPSFSLYEDQVGLVDWHQQYIGKPKCAVFHTQKAGRKRVIVATEENVVASVDLRHGELFWRHVLGEKDVIDHLDMALGKYVITLSSGGSILRAWNLPDGQMVWESFLTAGKPSKTLLLVAEKESLIFVYRDGHLHAVSSIDGSILWNLDLATESVEVQQLFQPDGGDVLYVVGLSSLSQLHTYQVGNGELLSHDVVKDSGGFSGGIALVSSETLVGLDATKSNLICLTLKDGKLSSQVVSIHDLVPDFSGPAVILPSKLEGGFALKFSTYVLFIRAVSEGILKLVGRVENAAAISGSLALTDESQAFGLVQHDGSKINLVVKHANDWENDLLKETIEMEPHHGLVEKVFLNNYFRTDRSNGFRALVVMEDHSLLLLQQGKIVWSREDGLASIVDVSTSELPLQKEGVSVAKVEHTLLEWLQGHILKLKGTLMLAGPEDVAAIQTLRLKSSGRSKMTRDRNGFRKLLIVLTKGGKLYALHTGDGHVVWSLLLPSLRKSDVCQHPIAVFMYQWQVPHHHVLDENPSVVIIGKCGLGIDDPVVLSFVDTFSGNLIESSSLGHSIVHVIPLPHTDSAERRLHLMIDSNKQAHLYPKTPEASLIFQNDVQNVYWYSVNIDNGIISGHALDRKCVVEEDDFCFTTRQLWSIVFPVDSEKIIAATARKSNEVVHTQAKSMGDRDVKYKYVSKNILFVATVAPKATGGVGSVGPDESWLVVYLIDTVTGRILHRMTHLGSQGPVHAVFSENWVVYHYFNLRAHRYEMSVIEIYDESRAENKDIWKLIVGKHNLTSAVSVYSRPEVVTMSQSYFFTHSVKTIEVTSTAKGITSKQLLIGTSGDQVLALDKRYLDPRRSTNPTQAEREEGIIPLTDSLPIISQSYVTHALKVEGLRDIITVPAKLESTTLVFAYGVDLFFTHLAPSRTYDSLTEDFSYALLLLTIVVLVAAIFATWILSERKELRDKWR
ncbi:ER membrane protein complex subunit 1-like protein [Drosera capensis]